MMMMIWVMSNWLKTSPHLSQNQLKIFWGKKFSNNLINLSLAEIIKKWLGKYQITSRSLVKCQTIIMRSPQNILIPLLRIIIIVSQSVSCLLIRLNEFLRTANRSRTYLLTSLTLSLSRRLHSSNLTANCVKILSSFGF